MRIPVTAFSLTLLVATAAAQEPALDTTQKRYSYILGFQLGRSIALRLQGEPVEIDADALAQAIADVLNRRPPRINQEQFVATMTEIQEQRKARTAALAERNRAAGEAFLAANRSKEGVVQLPSGLQYKVITAGTGEKPAKDASVSVHYRGTLISGTEFDSSYSRGEPVTLTLDSVIPGFREALTMMPAGSKWLVYVPSALAYGEAGAGKTIGPNETLVFQLELLEVSGEATAKTEPGSK